VAKYEVAAVMEGMMGGGEKVPGFIVDNVMKLVDTNNDGKVDRHEFDQVLRI
jgi:Ca2+-binding EF-hand superfamily protein